MSFDWTKPTTWTLVPGECVEFADAVIQYCDNCSQKYPEARKHLANLRERASQLRTVTDMSESELNEFCNELAEESELEGSGFIQLAKYVKACKAQWTTNRNR